MTMIAPQGRRRNYLRLSVADHSEVLLWAFPS